MLRLYAKRVGCPRCNNVKKWLGAEHRNLVEGQHYEIIYVDDPGADSTALQERGFQSVPVIFIDGQEPFHGVDVTRLEAWRAALDDVQ